MSSTFHDLPAAKLKAGRYLPYQHGPTMRDYAPDTGSLIISQTCWLPYTMFARRQELDLWDNYELAGSNGMYLVDWSEPRDLGGLWEWQQKYARVPKDRVEYTTMIYPFIGYVADGLGKLSSVVELPRKATCRITREYFHVKGPRDLERRTKRLKSSFRLDNIGGEWYKQGTPPPLAAGRWFLAEDETIEPWRGHIYVVTSREVLTPHLEKVTTIYV